MKDFLAGAIKELWHALMIGAGVMFVIDTIDRYKLYRNNEMGF